MEKLDWQEMVRAGKSKENEQANVHNQLVSEAWGFLEALAEKGRFQNTDFDIKITYNGSDKAFEVRIETRKVNSFTDNRMFTTFRTMCEDCIKTKNDEVTCMACSSR